MAETFNVIYRGDIAPGTTLVEVRDRLQEYFNLDKARAAQLFSGRPVVVRKNLDRERAEHFCDLLAGMGALAQVMAIGEVSVAETPSPLPSPPSPARPETAAFPVSTPPGTDPVPPVDSAGVLEGVTIDPPGADVLRPHERTPETHRDIPTGHFTVDPPGADVLKPHERRQQVSLDLDLSHLRVESADNN